MEKEILTTVSIFKFSKEKEKTKGYLLPLPDITASQAHTSVRAIINNLNPKSRKGKDNMRFTTNAKQLSETLVNMNRVINTKNVIPILADIVFTVKDDNLTLKASDSEVVMETTIALTDCEGEGSFAINGKDVMEAVKNLPDNPLTFSMEENDKVVKIDYFSGVFTLPIDNIVDYLNADSVLVSVRNRHFKKYFDNDAIWIKSNEIYDLLKGLKSALNLTNEKRNELIKKANTDANKLYSMQMINRRTILFLKQFLKQKD